MIYGERGGTKDNWAPGELAYFEYHCWRDHKSSDAEAWYRDHQQVAIIGLDGDDDCPDLATVAQRGAAGAAWVYRVRFPDGLEWSAVEDELLISWRFFDPALGPPSAEEITDARVARAQ